MFCRSLFVLLSFFFWPLCCLFFFDIRILITPFGIFKLFFFVVGFVCMCVRGTDLRLCFYDFTSKLCNCSDSGVFFAFNFIAIYVFKSFSPYLKLLH